MADVYCRYDPKICYHFKRYGSVKFVVGSVHRTWKPQNMGPATRLAHGSQGACLRTSGQAFAWGRCECRGILAGVTDGDGE